MRNYLRYDLKRELAAWLKIGQYYLPVLIVAAIAIGTTLFFIKPFPDQSTYLAMGQSGSLSDQTGRAFAEYFRKHGLDLTIENMAGLDSGLQLLESNDSKINASFVTSGTATRDNYPNLVSLGSVQVAPLWLFYRGDKVVTDDPFEYYKDKQISIGAEGTVTNKLFLRLMELNNPGTGIQKNFLQLTHAEAAEQLRKGKIDAMFIVDGINSKVVESLIHDPEIRLMNFPLADAYIKNLPSLQKVVVPRASIEIAQIRPNADITLLAASVNLLVEKSLHSSIQWAFLLAAKDANLKTEHFFSSSASYPKYQDKSFPLSEIADRFYTTGTPALFNYLPIWFAALIENIWVELLAFFLVILPVAKKVFGFRTFTSKRLLARLFWELRYLEDEALNCKSKSELEQVIARLQELEATAAETWIEDQDLRFYFNLSKGVSSSIQAVKKQMEQYP
jgi:TRAP-type uncharacterized transport system substrate-binding protein